MTIELIEDERAAVVIALREWLTTYAQGVLPAHYAAVMSAAKKIEEERSE